MRDRKGTEKVSGTFPCREKRCQEPFQKSNWIGGCVGTCASRSSLGKKPHRRRARRSRKVVRSMPAGNSRASTRSGVTWQLTFSRNAQRSPRRLPPDVRRSPRHRSIAVHDHIAGEPAAAAALRGRTDPSGVAGADSHGRMDLPIEEPTPEERAALAAGRTQHARGEFVSLDEIRDLAADLLAQRPKKPAKASA